MTSSSPEHLTAEQRYLDVRYSESARPFTEYPTLLTQYLTERYLPYYKGAKLLDLGCGRGEFLHGFASNGFAAVGVDRSRSSYAHFPETVLEVDYEKQRLPFEDGEFDVVFNKSVLEHVSSIGAVLNECQRVLGRGGRLISLVPDWTAQWQHFYDDWTHVRPFTLTGLKECIQSHGFQVKTAVRFRQLPLLWQRPYLRPLADAAALLPDPLKRFKFVRFAKEWMLLVVADKP